MEFYPAIKKNEIMTFSGEKWMELEPIILSKASWVKKDKGYMFTCRF